MLSYSLDINVTFPLLNKMTQLSFSDLTSFVLAKFLHILIMLTFLQKRKINYSSYCLRT